MISIENSNGRVIVAVARTMVSIRSAGVTVPRRASSAVQFSTITMVASAISPMAIDSPARANRLMVWSNADSGSAVNSVPSEQHADRRDRGAQVLQRQRDDHDDDEQLVADRLEEIRQRVPDQPGAVVGRDELDALRAASVPTAASLSCKRARDREHVAPLLHDGDAADDLSLAVEIGDAPPQVVADLQVADVAQVDRLACLVAADDEVLELVEVLGVDRPAQLVFAVGHLDRATASFLERAPGRRQ